MGKLLDRMIETYDTKEKDWMNYTITDGNEITFHHIKEKINGGEKTSDNGALITRWGHNLLNEIATEDPEKYLILNTIFKIINKQKSKVREYERELIEEVLETYIEERLLLGYTSNSIMAYQDDRKGILIENWCEVLTESDDVVEEVLIELNPELLNENSSIDEDTEELERGEIFGSMLYEYSDGLYNIEEVKLDTTIYDKPKTKRRGAKGYYNHGSGKRIRKDREFRR